MALTSKLRAIFQEHTMELSSTTNNMLRVGEIIVEHTFVKDGNALRGGGAGKHDWRHAFGTPATLVSCTNQPWVLLSL